MAEYSSNSHKSRENSSQRKNDPKNLEPVVSGTMVAKKKSGFGKFLESMIVTSANELGTVLLEQVLIPKTKDLFCSLFTEGINMLFYGRSSAPKPGSSTTRISYNSISYNRDPDRYSSRSSELYDYNDIVYPTKGEAMYVLERMEDVIDQFGNASIGDFYDLSDVKDAKVPAYTLNNYGWTREHNLRDAKIYRTFNGEYIISMPKAIQLD